MSKAENNTYRVGTDGFYGELFLPKEDKYPGKALICFSGSDGGIELAKQLADVFQAKGLTTLALAYVLEEGLPGQFSGVPIDFLEAAAKRLHDMGYQKVGLWGISKGAELALVAGSLLPGLVNAVVAVDPMNTVCQGFVKDKGISFVPGSSWSFHGKDLPYSAYGTEKFPLGSILRKSLKIMDVTMYDLYLPLVENPNPEAVIKAENITGPILLISSKMDNMWPSELAAKHIMKRLQDCSFPYAYKHLSYDYGGHMFVPMDMKQLKLFKGDRGKIKNPDAMPVWTLLRKHWNLFPSGKRIKKPVPCDIISHRASVLFYFGIMLSEDHAGQLISALQKRHRRLPGTLPGNRSRRQPGKGDSRFQRRQNKHNHRQHLCGCNCRPLK